MLQNDCEKYQIRISCMCINFLKTDVPGRKFRNSLKFSQCCSSRIQVSTRPRLV